MSAAEGTATADPKTDPVAPGAGAVEPETGAVEPETGAPGWLVPLLVLVGGMFMVVLDISIVNVAVPTIQRDFGASVDDIQWISTAYNLTLAATVPLAGWIGDRVGLTKIYLICLGGFAVGSALCGLAWNIGSMIAFRILQAVPGGVLPVVTMALLYTIVPREKMGTAMGIFGQGIIVGPAVGPTLGGYLVEYVDWRLIFMINVPVAVGGVVAGWFLLPRLAPTTSRPFDWWGFITAAVGLFSLLLAVSKGEEWGWTSYRVLIMATTAALSIALFVVIELEREQPLIDLRVFKNRVFCNSLVVMTVLTVGLFAVLFYLPLYMQANQGKQALHVGLVLMPEAIVLAILMPIAGRLYDKVGPLWPGVIGLAVACVGGFLLSGINPNMTDGDVIFWTCVRAAGNGLAMMPIVTAGLSSIPPALTTSASLMNNVIQQMSSALGLAAMTVLATRQQAQLTADRSALIQDNPAKLATHGIDSTDQLSVLGAYRELQLHVTADAYSNVFLVAAGLTVLGLVLACFIRRPPVGGVVLEQVPDAGAGPSGSATEAGAAPQPAPQRELAIPVH